MFLRIEKGSATPLSRQIAQQIGSLMIGGYVAGRMRTRWSEPGDEVEFRDGLHGGLVWAVGVLISALLIFATAGAAARTRSTARCLR